MTLHPGTPVVWHHWYGTVVHLWTLAPIVLVRDHYRLIDHDVVIDDHLSWRSILTVMLVRVEAVARGLHLIRRKLLGIGRRKDKVILKHRYGLVVLALRGLRRMFAMVCSRLRGEEATVLLLMLILLSM